MRHLILPTATEALIVRGQFDFRYSDGALWATEAWERYRNVGSDVETVRTERRSEAGTLRGHALLSPTSIERLRLQWESADGRRSNISLTALDGSWLLNENGTHREWPTAPQGGLLLPVTALVQVALPFPLAREGAQLAELLVISRPSPDAPWQLATTRARFEPLPLRHVDWRGTALRLKGWQWGAWGHPTQSAWFDRNGNCLAFQCHTAQRPWRAMLTSRMSFA